MRCGLGAAYWLGISEVLFFIFPVLVLIRGIRFQPTHEISNQATRQEWSHPNQIISAGKIGSLTMEEDFRPAGKLANVKSDLSLRDLFNEMDYDRRRRNWALSTVTMNKTCLQWFLLFVTNWESSGTNCWTSGWGGGTYWSPIVAFNQ